MVPLRAGALSAPFPASGWRWWFRSAVAEDRELAGFLDYMEKLKNHERSGVPKGAGTDTDEGFDLGRMRRLMRRLGDPHSRFKAVHIAGTKGKGSTAAFLSNILRAEGYSVGCYTSPHLLTIRECISLGKNGEAISSETLNYIFNEAKENIDQSIQHENGALSHFEVFTALAFTLFAQEKVDVAVVETGLGGARDATNVIQSSELAASVITTIGEEHLDALGGSLESIAKAKAGIIKRGCPLVIGGPFDSQIERIIIDRASSMNSPVVSACDPGVKCTSRCFGTGGDGRPYHTCDIHIEVQGDFKLSCHLTDVEIRMLGNHQLQNAAVATCTALCLRNQGWKITDESIRVGLECTQLPGRSHFLSHKEIEALGLTKTSVLVDGAHTQASAKCLVDLLEMVVPPSEPFALVVAMASDKDHLAFARQLLSGRRPEVVVLTEVSIAGGRSRTTPSPALKEAWASAAGSLGIQFLDLGMVENESGLLQDRMVCDRAPSSSSKDKLALLAAKGVALEEVLKIPSKFFQCSRPGGGDSSGLIVVTGSLHIVSEVLAAVCE